MKLHADWPEFDPSAERYNLQGPTYDLAQALAEGETRPVHDRGRIDCLSLTDLASIERYHVSYHGQVWSPANQAVGTELSLYVVGRLLDGRWFSVVAWNDYTGWGCQDGSDVRIGATEDDVVSFGLDAEGRSLLGYAAGGAS